MKNKMKNKLCAAAMLAVSTPFVDKTNNNLIPAATDQGAALFFVNAPFAPSAVSVAIGGRVLAPNNRGLASALVYLTDRRGEVGIARTNSFGIYRFEDVRGGESYVVKVVSKRYRLAAQIISIVEQITDLNFVAEP